jgi:hypothetical protein
MGERTIPPFSLRLTFEERAKLERDAAGMALGAYIRSRLLDPETVAPRKRGKFPVKDHQALAQLLGAAWSITIGEQCEPTRTRCEHGKPCRHT